MMKQLNTILLIPILAALMLAVQPVRAEGNPLLDKRFWEIAMVHNTPQFYIKKIISDIASVNETGVAGTPLHYAVAFGPAEAIPILVAAGADVNARADISSIGGENTPYPKAIGIKNLSVIHLAVRANTQRVQKLKELISAGVDVNVQDIRSPDDFKPSKSFVIIGSGSPLHDLARYGGVDTSRDEQSEIVKAMKILVSAGADINATDANGNTALHDAFYGGTLAAINYLIDIGADQTIRNVQGYTPYDLVFERYSANPLFGDWFYLRNFFRFTKNLERISSNH